MSQDLVKMMRAYQVEAPDTADVEDVRRALTQLRERMVVRYQHVATFGHLLNQLPADLPEADRDERSEGLTELARANRANRGMRKRARRGRGQARSNPLTPEEVAEAVDFAGVDDADPASVPALRTALARDRGAARTQPLTRAVVSSLFPVEGTRATWAAQPRFGEALSRYDLVTRLGLPEPPPAAADTNAPFTNRAALEYIIETSGLSLHEAQAVLRTMKASAENKGPGGGDKAMQPSSAMCKVSRTRKVPGYRVPAEIANKVGFDSVVILVSPVGQQPRVMTFRHGSHIDCDLVGSGPPAVLGLIGRALQVTLYWLAEKPKRLQKTKVYVGQVGSPEVFLAWAPGAPVSAEVAFSMIRKGAAFRITSGTADTAAYVRAVKDGFGVSGQGPESLVRMPAGVPAGASGRKRSTPSSPPATEGVSLDEAMAAVGRSALEDAIRAVEGLE